MVETFNCTGISLKEGSKGEKVQLLQTHLKSLGFYTSYNGHYLKIDGKYATYTKKAVKSFQKSVGITQDGKFGPITCKSLNEAILKKNGIITNNTNSSSTGTPATQTNTNTATKTAALDPYAINTENNVFKINDADLHIQGIHLKTSAITVNNTFNSGNWKTIELTSGKNYIYLGNDLPREYSVEVYLNLKQYEKLKPELDKIGRQVCRVASSEIIEPGHYLITIQAAPAKKTHIKLTIKLTEYI